MTDDVTAATVTDKAVDLALVTRQHSPEGWWLRGIYPWCSCGYAPKDNSLLYQHWADHGISWYDNHGHLEWREVSRERPRRPDSSHRGERPPRL